MFNIKSYFVAILGGFFLMASCAFAAEKEPAAANVKGATTVNAQEAKKLFDAGVIFVDPRKDADYEAGRIPDAEHLNLLNGQLTKENLEKIVKPSEKVVFYCNGEKCHMSEKAAKKAINWGYKKVYYFRGGLPAWKAAGYPVE